MLGGVVTKLHCSLFYKQLAKNKVPHCAITHISSLKLHISIIVDSLACLFWKNWLFFLLVLLNISKINKYYFLGYTLLSIGVLYI